MSMSASMLQGLNSLVSINSQISELQLQASSGKKINTASDGLAAYLSAKGYSQRADRLQNVNDTLGNNLQTVKAAKTGLDSIRKTITDTLDTLKAASQTTAYSAGASATETPFAVNDPLGPNTNSPTQFKMTFRSFDQTNTAQNTKLTSNTNLVSPITGQATSYLQLGGVKIEAGQIYSITGAGGTTYLKVAAANSGSGGDGSSSANARNVTTIGELLAGIRGVVTGGSDNAATVEATAAGFQNNAVNFGGTGTLGFSVTGAAGGAALNADNLRAMFAANRPTKPNGVVSSYTKDEATSPTIIGGTTSYTLTAKDYKVTTGSDSIAADSRRAAAAKSFKLALDQINQYLKNASVSGTNLLNGDALKVTFDEKGTSSILNLQDAGNNALTFGALGLGLVNPVSGQSDDIAQNFATNDDGNSKGLNFAIDKLTNSLSVLSLGDSQVAQFEATVQNRVDFNKAIVGLLGEAANSLTAADMTQVSTQYAALQVQQGFAQTMMANTKQSDQSILQLLR